jgi:predicted NodU family carbamoyl transferase
LPYFCNAKRSAASAVSSKTKLEVWEMGTARARVVGSGRAPACRALVRNPKARSGPPVVTSRSYNLTKPMEAMKIVACPFFWPFF